MPLGWLGHGDDLNWHKTYTGERVNNSVTYNGNFSGITFGAQYGFGEQAGDNSANRMCAFSLGYKIGPAALEAFYQQAKDTAGKAQKALGSGRAVDAG